MRHRAFTLIELLVVVAIIVALLALLMPSMGRAIEFTQRAACASNQHQLFVSTLNYATDNHGRFVRVNAPSKIHHVSWINRDAVDYYVPETDETGGRMLETEISSESLLYCPNRVQRWRGVHKGDVRIGFYLLFAREQGNYIGNPSAGIDAWTSPVSLGAITDPSLPLITDIIEANTWTPNNSTVSHAATGYVERQGNVEPEEMGSEGVNSTFPDGAVHWRDQSDLNPRGVRENDLSTLGWF